MDVFQLAVSTLLGKFFCSRYKIVLDSDAEEYGEHKRLDHSLDFFTFDQCWDNRYHSLKVIFLYNTAFSNVIGESSKHRFFTCVTLRK